MLVDLTARPQIVADELSSPQPRSGHELILATKPFAKDNTVHSWWCILSTSFFLLTALGGTLWHFHPAIRAMFSVLTGLLLLRLFVIYHDQQHHSILPKSRLANAYMKAFGILALAPSTVWRSSHNHHHSHNSRLRGSQIGSYPIMTRDQFIKTPADKRRVYLFIRHPLTILFGYVFMFIYGMCLNPFFNYPRRHIDCLVAFVVHILIAVTLLYFGGWMALLFAQLIPHFIASAIGSYLFYAQHNFPDVSFDDNAGWTFEKAALESSSFMRMSPVMGWFTANIGYHHIHHLNSRIPFYRLPEVMRSIPELRRIKTTSLSPIQVYRCLRLKVWDVQAQRMVGVHNL